MLLVRSCRRKVYALKAVSRNFITLSSKNPHSKDTYGACSSKLSCFLSSRFPRHLLGFQSYCSRESSNTSEISDVSGQHQSLNISDSICVESPDVATYSEEYIEHFRKSNNVIVRGESIPPPIFHFDELPLPGVLKEVLRQENYPKPTPIQSQGWPVAFNQRDMVGVSQTGSGKTLAYMLPAILHVSNTDSSFRRRDSMHDIPAPKVLILGPTRELVQQILQVSRKYIQVSHLKGACVYGGATRGPQLRHLQGADICVATPGRLLDYLENRETSLKSCTYLVLDEADRMLDMGFEPQIREIIDHIPNERQTLMWSATWPKEIRNLAEDFLTNYIHITVGDADLVANPNIQQKVYVVDEEEKFEKFLSLMTDIIENEPSKILVFAETKRKVNELAHLLREKGIDAWGIHGDCTQNQRDRVLRNFRTSSSSILIATDIASRGLDITDIHHVFNYDFPANIEDYIHRIGRTARGAASGTSHSFFTEDNFGVLKDLISVLKKTNQKINPDLYSLIESAPSKFYKPQKRYNYNRSFGNRKFYGNKMSYGNSRYNEERMPYGNSRYNEERMPYGNSRYNEERMSYGNSRYNEERMSYGKNRFNDERTKYGKQRINYVSS